MKKLFLRFLALFRKEVREEVQEETGTQEDGDYPDYLMGDWTLSTLLDELPVYHRILSKNKKYWNSDIGPALRMGPLISPYEASYYGGEIKERIFPAQFFTSFINPKKSRSDQVHPSLLAAIKVDPPLTVERGKGHCYKILLYLEEYDYWIGGHVWFDGKSVKPARQKRKVMRDIPRNGGYPHRVPSIVYSCPLVDAFFDPTKEFSPEETISLMFIASLNFWAERDKGWLVVSKKNGMRASFAVHEGQHKYFFKDRDKIVTTPTGQRKRIFHLVTGHYRNVKGKKKWIKEHKRGQRHFFWHGTECHIFAPGWHGKDIWRGFDAKAYDPEEVGEDFGLDAGQVAEKFSRIMEGTSVR